MPAILLGMLALVAHNAGRNATRPSGSGAGVPALSGPRESDERAESLEPHASAEPDESPGGPGGSAEPDEPPGPDGFVEPDAPDVLSAAAENEPLERFGAFTLERRHEEDGVRLKVFGPGGRELLETFDQAVARPVADLKIGGKPALIIHTIAAGCERHCNPWTLLLGARGDETVELFNGRGLGRLQDLDGDGAPELLLDYLVSDGDEVVTLPLRRKGERFVGAHARFPEGVDRQLKTLGEAIDINCADKPTDECQGQLRAALLLMAFRGDAPSAAIAGLGLGPAAQLLAKEESLEARSELEALISE